MSKDILEKYKNRSLYDILERERDNNYRGIKLAASQKETEFFQKYWYNVNPKSKQTIQKIIKRIAGRIADDKYMRMTLDEFHKFVSNVRREDICHDETYQQYLLKDGTWTSYAPSREYNNIVSLCCGYIDEDEEPDCEERYLFCFEYGILGETSEIISFSE